MLEKKHEHVLPLRQFIWRVVRFAGLAVLVILIALGIGVAGYHWIAGLSFIDALLNASMILSGMGPVNEISGDRAKLFAAAYALFSGLVFITVAGMLFTPLFHRVIHRFHVDDSGK